MPNKKPCLNFIKQLSKTPELSFTRPGEKNLIVGNLSTKRLIEENRNVKIIPKGARQCLSCPCDLQPLYHSLHESQDITICQFLKL